MFIENTIACLIMLIVYMNVVYGLNKEILLIAIADFSIDLYTLDKKK